jgi:hypothetical protein
MVKARLATSNHRRKTEALAQVVDRIVCHFRRQQGAGRRPGYTVAAIEVFSRTGNTPTTYQGAGLFAGRVGEPPPHKKQGSTSCRSR